MPVRFPSGVDDAGEPEFTKYWSVTEAAPMLHVTRATLREKCRSGEWECLRNGSGSRTRYYVSAAQMVAIVQLLTSGGCGLDESPVQLGEVRSPWDETEPVQ